MVTIEKDGEFMVHEKLNLTQPENLELIAAGCELLHNIAFTICLALL